MPALATVRDALLQKLESELADCGRKKEASYGEEYGIDRVSVSDNLFQRGDLTYYAHSKGEQKVIELYLSRWPKRTDCIEAAIMITHGVDVSTIKYGDTGDEVGNQWFFAATVRAMLNVLADFKFAEVFARPTADDPDRVKYLTKLYKAIGFRDLEPGQLVFPLDDADAQHQAMQATEKWSTAEKK